MVLALSFVFVIELCAFLLINILKRTYVIACIGVAHFGFRCLDASHFGVYIRFTGKCREAFDSKAENFRLHYSNAQRASSFLANIYICLITRILFFSKINVSVPFKYL